MLGVRDAFIPAVVVSVAAFQHANGFPGWCDTFQKLFKEEESCQSWEEQMLPHGASIYDVRKIFGFFDPLLPLSLSQISWFCSFCMFIGDPLPPPNADVINGSHSGDGGGGGGARRWEREHLPMKVGTRCHSPGCIFLKFQASWF